MTEIRKYLVWCLSWEDEPEHGTHVTAHEYVARYSDSKKEIVVSLYDLTSPQDAARIYAQWMHGNRDGWEATWPLTFRVRSQDGTERDFEVTREMVPEFSATEVKAK